VTGRPKGQPGDLAGATALAALSRLEHQVRSQRAALEAVPQNVSVPSGVMALLRAPAIRIQREDLATSAWPRLAVVAENLQWLQAELTTRQQRVAVNLAAVRHARRPRPSGRVLDWRT
jgi:hypothetical protein